MKNKNREVASHDHGKQWLLVELVAFTCLVSAAAGAAPIKNYSPVTSARPENPEPGKLDAVSLDL